VKPVLRIPTYRRLLAAYALNELAFMVGSVTLTLLIYERTGSAFGSAAFFICAQFVPALISPMLVARLDQLRPRSVLPVLYWIETVIFVVLAAMAGRHFMLLTVLALTLLNGVIALAARSLARTATVTVTSAVGLLREGNAVANGAFSVCMMIGPGLGGVVVAAGGTSLALLGDAALFGVIGVTLATATDLPGASPLRAPARGRVRAALDYTREEPGVRRLLILQGVGILFFMISVPVEVVFVQRSLHGGAAAYGGLVSAWGAGAVAGAAAYARWRRLPMRALITAGAVLLGVGFVIMAGAPTLSVAIIGAVCAGIGNGMEGVSSRTALQELVADQWMALMISLQESVLQSVPGAAILIGGTITALGSPRTALAVAGVGSLVIAALIWVMLRDMRPRAETAGDVAPPQDPIEVPRDGAVAAPDQRLAEPDGSGDGARRKHAPTPAARHQ
jgi:Major Facilitator Superfamily